ncbi:MAG TPA: PBP1A family penicillin-binding protein, partial [Candidatus Methylomirabilis sp.]|nr:PBP1A family penicillin-binding protein [Candidatus Methylomirabilis sp.]
MEFLRRHRGRLLWTLPPLVAIGMGAAGGVFAAYIRDLPTLDALEQYSPSLVTTLYSDEDEPFAAFFEQRRILISLDKIPRYLIEAVLATEDTRFYSHRGIDPRGIARALLTNLRTLRLAEGGSTITQQLAKVLFLTPEKSLTRKIKEVLLAFQIEREYSKDRILEMYFNQIYFGHGAYGVEAAAQTYFGKSVDELNVAEAAMLAGLPRAPNSYSPIVDKERARRRRAVVLQRMVEEEFITPEQAEAAAAIPFDERAFAAIRSRAPYFVEYVRQYLEEHYGSYALYHGGLRVYTTLNLRLQGAAEQTLTQGLDEIDQQKGLRLAGGTPIARATPRRPGEPLRPGLVVEGVIERVTARGIHVTVENYSGEIPFKGMRVAEGPKLAEAFHPDDRVLVRLEALDHDRKTLRLVLAQEPEMEGALLALDPRTGQIKAMVGGYDFQRSKFNRAIQARRQPGSAFKPFVYAAAFDLGLTPSTIFEDSPVSFPATIDGEQKEWSPENYDQTFRGPVTLRQGLEHSINVVAVKLLETIGVGAATQMAHRLGIRSPLRAELGLALGTSEVTLLEMVSAYGTLAAGGIRTPPYAIRRILDSRGRVLEEHYPEGQPVLRPATAAILTHVLEGVVERGTGRGARVLERPLAAKTGTTQDAADAWFLGYSPSLAAGVWIGYDTVRSLGTQETAATLAAPVWIRFMRAAVEDSPPEAFPVPDPLVPVTVNYYTGLPTYSQDPDAVTEYFLRGTEPRRATMGGTAAPLPSPSLLGPPLPPPAAAPLPPAPPGTTAPAGPPSPPLPPSPAE